MMTTTAAPPVAALEDNAQALVDARLDTIERMLLGQVPRADRLAIVREVETQIHHLLGDRNPDETDRAAVIAALSRLDPPEAYLPEDAGAVRRSAPTPVMRPRVGVAATAITLNGNRPVGSAAGKVSGILGIGSIVLLIATGAMLLIATNAKAMGVAAFTFLGLAIVTDLVSVVAIALASYARFQGAWAVVGLTMGIICFVVSLIGFLFGLL